MALAPISQISTPFEDFPGQFLKGFAQGTTNPIVMATDSGGLTTVAKAEISSGGVVPIGFIKTAGDAIFIPYFSVAYDLWIFPTAAEADANDTDNAVQVADDMSFLVDFANSVGITQTFNTKDLMVADIDLALGNIVTTNGYTTIGDRGNNTYEVVGAGSGTDDDGSFIDLPNTTPALQAKALFPGGRITPQQFGVIANGVTQNLTTWNLMVVYVNSVGGKTIYCPEGQYNFGNTQGANVPSNSIIEGDGIGATEFLQLSSATNRGGFDIDGASNLTLRDFTFTGTRAGDTAVVDNTCIITRDGVGADNILIEDVEIKDFGFYGIEIRDCDDVMINRCRLTNLGRAGVLGIGCLRNYVHNCFIKNISPGSGGNPGFLNRFGITFSMDESTPGRRSQFCEAINNHIEDISSWEAIDTHGGVDILIDGNTIINCAIGVFIGSATSTANLPPERWKVVNNHFNNTGNAVSRAAILLAASPDGGTTVGNDFVISNNYIQGYGTHDEAVNQEGALDITFARDITVTGNNFIQNLYSHIRLGEDIILCQITGNTFRRAILVDGKDFVLNAQNSGNVQATFDNNTAYRQGGTMSGIIIQAAPSNETVFGIKVGANNRFIDLTLDFEASAAGRMHSQSGIFITDTTTGNVDAAAAIRSSNNIASIAHTPASGIYTITLTTSYINTNNMRPVADAIGTTAISAVAIATAANTVEVRTFDTAGVLTDNAFILKMNGRIAKMP